jgi:HEAT repeat protein
MSSPSKNKKQPVEAHLNALHAIRHADPLPVDQLREALKHPTNAVVAKAANIAGDRQATALAPDLVPAAKRFFDKPDPGCLAKIATVRALKALEHLDAEMFYRGLKHIQMEAAYLGPVDTAGPLRAISALAISECRAIPPREALRALIDALTDTEVSTRIDIVRAIGQVTSLEADAVLRTKARLGDAAVEVTGQCLLSLIEREGKDALPFAASFFKDPELRIEAAMAIAAQRGAEALASLIDAWEKTRDRELLLAIGTLRTPEAVAWLIPLLEDQPTVRKALEPCRHIPGVEDALAQSR